MDDSPSKLPAVHVGKTPDRGEAWSHEDREIAFHIYVDPKQGGRSLRRTSRLTGIPFQTLARWNQTEEWQRRIWQKDEREANAIRQSVQMRLVNELDGMMDQLVEVAYTGTNADKTRLEAIKLALGIASFSAVQKVETDIITNDTTKTRKGGGGGSPALDSSVSVAELSERLNAKLAALSGDTVTGEIIDAEEAEDTSR